MHVPVLLDESIELLDVRPGGRYLDATAGSGGHSEALLRASAPDGQVLAIDRDPDALARSQKRLAPWAGRYRLEYGNFADMATIAKQAGMDGFDGVLADLGVSSEQLDTASRGFSFSEDGPLDMRMDPAAGETAAELVERLSEAELADLLWTYGEERHARRIARRIVKARREAPLTTTAQLADVVRRGSGGRRSGQDPATRSFQALRIAVNAELDSLERGLAEALSLLREGGRMAAIAFHSLEDRIVKRFFRAHAVKEESLQAGGVRQVFESPAMRIITRRPVTPGEDEIARNPRARSAKLRVAERIADPVPAG